MSSSSTAGGGSSGGSPPPTEEENSLRLLMDHRKRRRMESNRESAKRSRMRKQKHVDDLTAQAAELRRQNGEVLRSLAVTAAQLSRVEAENSVLRAQAMELSQRLHSLNGILDYVSSYNSNNGGELFMTETEDNNYSQISDRLLLGDGLVTTTNNFNNVMIGNNNNMMGFVGHNNLQCPIVASADAVFGFY